MAKVTLAFLERFVAAKLAGRRSRYGIASPWQLSHSNTTLYISVMVLCSKCIGVRDTNFTAGG
jgi:hypothetical protein